ncbi:hypothetical protein Q3G72_020732 [Acer saccharum]|nr:hypothetical protein Q3G72_020732 [Acer saccharum]
MGMLYKTEFDKKMLTDLESVAKDELGFEEEVDISFMGHYFGHGRVVLGTQERNPRWLLKQEVPKIVKSINRQLREKSIKTKVVAFSVLRELVVVLPDNLANHIGSLIPGIEKALNVNKNSFKLKMKYYFV